MLPTTTVTIEDRSDNNDRDEFCSVYRTKRTDAILTTTEPIEQSQTRKDDECG